MVSAPTRWFALALVAALPLACRADGHPTATPQLPPAQQLPAAQPPPSISRRVSERLDIEPRNLAALGREALLIGSIIIVSHRFTSDLHSKPEDHEPKLEGPEPKPEDGEGQVAERRTSRWVRLVAKASQAPLTRLLVTCSVYWMAFASYQIHRDMRVFTEPAKEIDVQVRGWNRRLRRAWKRRGPTAVAAGRKAVILGRSAAMATGNAAVATARVAR